MKLGVSQRVSLTGKISERMPSRSLLGPSPHEAANRHAADRSLLCQSDMSVKRTADKLHFQPFLGLKR